jgi:apolipoprotein N-acyltransferase
VRGDDRVRAWIESLAARARAPLVLGSIAFENRGRPDETWYNGMFVVAPDLGLQTAYYTKRHLVPFGEYVPLRFLLGWLHKFVPVGDDDFARGVSASPLFVPVRKDSLAIGPLICFEDIFPALARADVRDGADVLFVATNDAWYGEGGAAYQHAAHSVLRAVETRRPVLRCGNSGWSGWIDEFGNIRAVLTRDASGITHTDPGIADATIYFRGRATINVSRDTRWVGRRSFYVEHGDWFVAVCAALAGLGYLLLRLNPAPAGGDPSDV